MKKCRDCGLEKPTSEFYTHPRMADGVLNSCKECHKASMRAVYAAKRHEKLAYDRVRNRKPHRRACRANALVRHRAEHPERARARNAVSNAIRDGRLVRPDSCPLCGSAVPVQAHHHDYARPLDVEWVCFKCHREKFHGQLVEST